MNRSDVNALYGKANNIYSGKLLNLVLSSLSLSLSLYGI